ncbi:TonB-dependent receptor [Bacteroidia bacterium]|nr:TonB-dependent receptor [Bacteroidia bacterium]
MKYSTTALRWAFIGFFACCCNIKAQTTLDSVVVTATARPQGTTMENIPAGQGRRSVDATGGSIESLVMTAGTGVASTNELSTQYAVRGGNYDENMVYVNGVEVYRPLLVRSGQQEGLSFINPDLVQSVQFSSGGFDACYGDKLSSVLDVTYKKPKKTEGGFMGSMLGGSAYFGNTTGKFSQITGVRYKRGTTLLNTLDTKGDYNPMAMDAQTFMAYAFTKKLSLNVLGNYSHNTYDFNPGNRETSYGTINDSKKFEVAFDGQEKDRFNTLFGAATLKYEYANRANISLQVSAFQSREQETYDITGEYWISNVLGKDKETIGTGLFREHARDQLHATVYNVALLGTVARGQHTLRWSAGAQKENIKDRINEWELRDSMGYSVPQNDEYLRVLSNLFSHNNLSSNRLFAYLQHSYRLNLDAGLFGLTTGVRAGYWDFNDELLISPRVSLSFIPAAHQQFKFRLATGIYYQPPFYKELRQILTDESGNGVVVLNKGIKSQRSIHLVAGGDYTFRLDDGRPFKLTTELYYKKLDNLIPYYLDNVRVWYAGENRAHGYAMGIDTKFFGQFVPGTDSWVGFSLMQAQQYINGKRVDMPTDQLYNFTLYYTDVMPDFERLQFNLRVILAQGLPFSAPGREYEANFRAPAYRRIDVGLTYRLTTHIWLGADIFNLFDIGNVSSYSWFTDVSGVQNAVPDRLTGRQWNFKVLAGF